VALEGLRDAPELNGQEQFAPWERFQPVFLGFLPRFLKAGVMSHATHFGSISGESNDILKDYSKCSFFSGLGFPL